MIRQDGRRALFCQGVRPPAYKCRVASLARAVAAAASQAVRPVHLLGTEGTQMVVRVEEQRPGGSGRRYEFQCHCPHVSVKGVSHSLLEGDVLHAGSDLGASCLYME